MGHVISGAGDLRIIPQHSYSFVLPQSLEVALLWRHHHLFPSSTSAMGFQQEKSPSPIESPPAKDDIKEWRYCCMVHCVGWVSRLFIVSMSSVFMNVATTFGYTNSLPGSVYTILYCLSIIRELDRLHIDLLPACYGPSWGKGPWYRLLSRNNPCQKLDLHFLVNYFFHLSADCHPRLFMLSICDTDKIYQLYLLDEQNVQQHSTGQLMTTYQ